MKKIALLIISIVLLFALLSCSNDETPSDTSSGSSVPADSLQGNDEGTDNSETEKPGGNDYVGESKFKVYIEFNGAPFNIDDMEPVIVVWNDGLSYYEAEADENGIAVADGLDGDYVVTLKNLPEGYTYNPNPYNKQNDSYGYEVTNDNPETTIEIFKIGTTKGAGSTEYNRAVITRTGAYRATLTGSDHKMFFEFAPRASGTYTIESWLPITDDKVNPKIDVYTSSFAAPIYMYTLDAGAAEGKYYTKNFKYEVEIADEMISSGGQVVFVFAVYATARNDKYFPVDVDFAVKYEGGFDLEHAQSTFMVPEELYAIMAKKIEEMKKLSCEELISQYGTYGVDNETYDALSQLSTAKLGDGASLNHFLNNNESLRMIAVSYLHEYFSEYYADIRGKTWKNPSTLIGSKKVLLGEGYEYNKTTGFYHKYDLNLYANDPYGYGKGYGPVVYADITLALRTGILDEPLNVVEYRGNKVLTVSNGTENYKLFIESFEKADAMSIMVLGGGIECDEELLNLIGYATIVNKDGAVPVTKEIKDFLQKYAVNQLMFMDGDGWAERAENPYESTEEDQWLFACGYYE